MGRPTLLSRIQRIEPIVTLDDLKRHLQLAIEIEHATIPPYLTAMYSLKEGTNSATWNVIHRIVIEEMLHFGLACNLLNAIGEPPKIAFSRFIPRYPTRLPESNTSFCVNIERCSDSALRTFMLIEKPHYPLPAMLTKRRPVGYRTIGEFYENVTRGFDSLYKSLGDGLFKGNPARQLVDGYFGGRDDLIAVTDLASAKRAIAVIVNHGEGTSVPDPHLPADQRPHYSNFQDVLRRNIIGPNGSPLPSSEQFNPSAVWPMVKNPRLAGDRVRLLSREFNELYSDLLEILQDVVTGNPSRIWDAEAAMRNCGEACVRLMQAPIGCGLNAGPTFEYVSRGRSRSVAIAADLETPTFSTVKAILDEAISDWVAQHGREPDLAGRHQDAQFGWSTKQQLLESTARGLRLIDPMLIGNGMGHQTNLVIGLRTGVSPFRRMPAGGPYVDDEDIDQIVAWINAGCLDDSVEVQRSFAAPIVEQSVEMLMRDPEVSRQSDLAPYPDGPGKLVHKWLISLRFQTAIGSPIQLKVYGIPGGTAGIRPGNIFDRIASDNVYQDTNDVYNGVNAQGCLVLQRQTVPETSTPPYDPTADQFPNPTMTYPFRRMDRNGRWFRVEWDITVNGGMPQLALSATQQPRVNNVAERRCP